jgi:hypothetical protein
MCTANMTATLLLLTHLRVLWGVFITACCIHVLWKYYQNYSLPFIISSVQMHRAMPQTPMYRNLHSCIHHSTLITE